VLAVADEWGMVAQRPALEVLAAAA
jgi:hypothetical protein